MMPLKRSRDGSPYERPDEPWELAQYAWQLAMTKMVEAANRGFQSVSRINRLRDENITIADTPADVVFEIDKVRVLRYRPLMKPRTDVPPILICYGLFGRQTMIDLQEDRSLVRNLLMAGLDVHVVDWGNPTRADQFLTFDDYIDTYLGGAMEHLVEQNGGKPVTLFGICEGGTFATALAALRPELFAALALAITPVDFHGKPDEFWAGEGFLVSWINNLDDDDIDLLLDVYGNLPGAFTGNVFSSLTPIPTLTKYNTGLAAMEGDEATLTNFLRMEKWIADRPDHPGLAARQWLKQLYRDNQLVKGTFEVSGETVDLHNIACPVLNIYALQDHIIPISCSKALGDFVPASRYEEIGFPGGHVGVFVSRKAQGVVAGGIIEWVERTQKKKGSGRPAPVGKPTMRQSPKYR